MSIKDETVLAGKQTPIVIPVETTATVTNAQTGNVDVTVKTRPYPAGTQTSHGSYAVSTSTTKQDTRIRGRQVAIRVASDAVDEDWRYGTLRLDMKPDGMRGA